MNQAEAEALIQQAIPDGKIQVGIFYRDLFVFIVFTSDPDEGEMDPFYSVNPVTKEVRDFSPWLHGDFDEVMDAFDKAREEAA